MKNFFIVLLMILIVVGTCFGVKAEIDAWNKKYNPTANVEEAKDMIDETKEKVEDINEDANDYESDLSELEY